VKEFRNPADVHQPVAAYSHQIEVRRPERWLVLSGQVGMMRDGSVPDNPIEQLDAALENLSRNLSAAKMGESDIVKLTIYLVGECDSDRRRELIAARLKDHRPCMTLIYVAALAAPIYKVEIDAWACV
jgi:enamine deaminase RidA (YjgF/YER057c/UK114 family)